MAHAQQIYCLICNTTQATLYVICEEKQILHIRDENIKIYFQSSPSSTINNVIYIVFKTNKQHQLSSSSDAMFYSRCFGLGEGPAYSESLPRR